LSVGGAKDIVGKTPKWESELWSYVGSGDGSHCPVYDHCQRRLRGGWCADDNREHISRLLYKKRVSPSSYDFLEHVTPCRIFQLVEMLAQKYLKKGGVHYPPVPNGLISLADEQHPVETHPLPLKVYHGATWFLKDKWILQVKVDDTSAAKRFTLFHEVFHILVHCRTTPMFRARGVKEGFFNELLAEHFANCVLLPGEWVKEKWAEVKDLDKMAEIFGVSKLAICMRLKHLGLT